MKKIAIIGIESTHAQAYLKYIKEDERFCNMEIAGIYSDEGDVAETFAQKYGVRNMENYFDVAGQVDGAIICSRRGSTHYKYALPYIRGGAVMLIDKPTTQSVEDATALANELERVSAKVTGGSILLHDPIVKQLKVVARENQSLLGGLVKAPIFTNSKYEGFFFYAQHLVDIVCAVFGYDPINVSAQKDGDEIKVTFDYGVLSCTGIYKERSDVFYAELSTVNGTLGGRIAENGLNTLLWESFDEFCALLTDGKNPKPHSELIAPVFIMNKIISSLNDARN